MTATGHKVRVTYRRGRGRTREVAATRSGGLEASELEEVRRWRFDELVCAGFDDDDAIELAFRVDIDLHSVIDLVRRGCPSKTAARIVL